MNKLQPLTVAAIVALSPTSGPLGFSKCTSPFRWRTRRRTRIAAVTPGLLLALLTTACSGMAGGPGPGIASPSPWIGLRVLNHSPRDIRVYVMRSGLRHRLGLVTSMSTRALKIPRDFRLPEGAVQLMAVPVGSFDTHVTEPIPVRSGQVIEWRVLHPLSLSSFSVRSRSGSGLP